MTRTIKASEIKPGMEIEWKFGGYYTRCVVGLVQKENLSYPAYSIRAVGSAAGWKTFSPGREVTVLKEAQPEEPTEFGAKIIVDGRRFLRAPLHSSDSTPWLSHLDGMWRNWSMILAMGPVTVVSDQGCPTPVDASWVPGRVDQWPEDDTALRAHQWRDWDRDIWTWVPSSSMWSCYDESGNYVYSYAHPVRGPWDRVTTNTTFNEKKENA